MSNHPLPSQESDSPAATGRASRREFPDLGRFWTWANMLTLTRIALVPVIAWLVYRDGPMVWLIGLLLVAIATDYLDGKVARRMGTVSEWGKVLDPVADKFAAAAVTLALVIRPVEPTLEMWFVLLVIGRDLLISAGGILQTRRLGYVVMALWSGKVAVNLLALTIVAVLFRAPQVAIDVLVWATTAVLLYSWAQYLYRFILIMRLGSDVTLDERHMVVRPGSSSGV